MNVGSSPSPWTCRYTAHVMPYLPRFRRVQGLASVANHHSATLSHTIVDIIATISRTHRRQATPRAGSGRASNSRQPSRKFPPQSLEARDSTIQALVLFMRPETAPLIVISTPRPLASKHIYQEPPTAVALLQLRSSRAFYSSKEPYRLNSVIALNAAT